MTDLLFKIIQLTAVIDTKAQRERRRYDAKVMTDAILKLGLPGRSYPWDCPAIRGNNPCSSCSRGRLKSYHTLEFRL